VCSRDAQPTACGPDPAPNVLYPALGQVEKYKIVVKKILLNYGNFININECNVYELLTVLQIITIWNGSDGGNNIKPLETKG